MKGAQPCTLVPRTLMFAGATLSLAFLTGSCSSPRQPSSADWATVEQTVATQISEALDGDQVKVTCPDSRREVLTQRCDARVVGDTESITIDASGPDVRWDWVTHNSFAAPFLSIDDVRKSIADGIEAKAGLSDVMVTCPSAIPKAAGASFVCSVSDDTGASRDVVVTQTDDQGGVTWDLSD